MPSLLSTLFLAAVLPAMPPAPIGDIFPTASKSPNAIIFEFTDYGGTKSTAKAKVTPESALSWCGSWQPGSDKQMKQCASVVVKDEADRVYSATANCQTGDLWSGDQHYVFNGADRSSQFFANYVSVKDVATGKPVGMSNAEGGSFLGAQWLTLCPLGFPYDQLPVTPTYKPGDNEILSGEHMGHNGSTVFFHDNRHIFTYADLKPSLAGTIAPDTVLFRGWHVAGEWISGVAYAFRKNCQPAPYLVSGRYDNNTGLKVILTGKAPVRHGCEVVAYSNDVPNAKLVFEYGGE